MISRSKSACSNDIASAASALQVRLPFSVFRALLLDVAFIVESGHLENAGDLLVLAGLWPLPDPSLGDGASRNATRSSSSTAFPLRFLRRFPRFVCLLPLRSFFQKRYSPPMPMKKMRPMMIAHVDEPPFAVLVGGGGYMLNRGSVYDSL